MSSNKAIHITLISLNFYPEDTAIGLYSTQLAQYLEKQGAEVSVITGFPYYPNWKIREDYKNKGSFYHEKIGDISIYRYKQFTPENPTFLKRIVQIVDFTIGTRINFKHIKNCDIVISVIPFTSSAWLGNTLSRKRNAKHWIHIQDFEFDAAFQSGLAQMSRGKSCIHKNLMQLERRILNKADRVSTISHAMLRKLQTKTSTPSYYLPNWTDLMITEGSTVAKHPFFNPNKFSILYAGNVGDKQDWLLFEKMVAALDDSCFEVIVVGAGARMEVLKKKLAQNKMVHFYNPVPLATLPQLLSSADVHILFQKKEVIDTVMPSKIIGMMGSSKPSIVTGHPDAETAQIIKDSKGGFYETPNTIQLILARLQQLREDPEAATTMGKNARSYVEMNYNKDIILRSFYRTLMSL